MVAAEPPTGHGVAVEPDRIETPMVVRSGILLAVVCVVAMLLIVLLFKFFERGAVARDAAAADAAGLERQQDRLPPPPRLQINDTRHWRQYRSAEEGRLSTYGWVDRAAGVAHIPIDRAMDLVAERGVAPLAPASGAQPAPAAPVPTPAPGARP